MKYEETLLKSVFLLEKLERVTILETDSTQEKMEIIFNIGSHKTHFWLEYCAEGANVPLDCFTKFRPWDKEAIENPSSALIYRFGIVKNPENSADFDNFNYLGSFLVWVMHAFDLIKTKEANCLLDFWNSMHVNEKKKENIKNYLQ